MYCEKCGQNPAMVHLVQVINGVRLEQNLCSSCAGGNQYGVLCFDFPMFDIADAQKPKKCECGYTISEFARYGLLGCPKCYETFADELNEQIYKVQRAVRHVGEESCGEAETLKIKLKQAIESENYEEAASLRDEIRKIEEGDSHGVV